MSITVPSWVPAAVTKPHSAKWAVRCLPRDGGAPFALPITAGTLVVDAGGWPRSSLEGVAVGDLSLAPQSTTAPLLPFGSRLDVAYTVSDGAAQSHTFAPCPPLYIDDVDVTRGPSVGMVLGAGDAALRISADTFPTPTAGPTSSRTVSTMLAYLIRRSIPGAVIRDDVGSTRPVGAGFQVSDDPWQGVEDLCDAIGAECYQEPDGAFRIRTIPSVSAAPAGTMRTGTGGTITATRSRIVRAPNRVILRFRDAAGAVVVGRWADTSATSGVGTAYGRVTLVETRDQVATVAQANDAAARYARRAAGRVRDVTLEGIAMPWLVPGDTVRVILANRTDDLVLTSVRHDLSGVEASTYVFRTDTIGPV